MSCCLKSIVSLGSRPSLWNGCASFAISRAITAEAQSGSGLVERSNRLGMQVPDPFRPSKTVKHHGASRREPMACMPKGWVSTD